MASIQYRTSRGNKYWSIVESRRVKGKPRTFILEYLGTATTLLNKIKSNNVQLKSYSHGDTSALLNIAAELDIINIINKYVPTGENKHKPIRDDLTVGASFLLAAIGRACYPTSKMGWYDWCKKTSMEYCLKANFKKLSSQHFWDQMNVLPSENISKIEEEIALQLIKHYKIKPGNLFFDTTNFFTFIDSTNERCDLPKRGRNKQKRFDLRQIGMALLVSKEDQFPLFHKTYRGDKNDVTVFKETYASIITRLKKINRELSDITIVFDKGNNSKDNFSMIDDTKDCYYVGGLVSSHFKDLLKEANKNFSTVNIEGEKIPVYRIKQMVWGKERTCVVTISSQLKEGQILGIKQHLEKKYKVLNKFKQQLENPKRRKDFTQEEIKRRLYDTIKGQFIEEILKFYLIKINDNHWSFTYYVDIDAFDELKESILGRKIVITNRHDWSSEEILSAYKGQSKVEYAFRTLKNPHHMAIRPQYHWTDQKIEAHFLICLIGYLLTTCAYSKIKSHYKKCIMHMMDDLNSIRLACITNKNNKVKYQLEKIPKDMQIVLKKLNISNETIRQKLNFSDYI